MYILLTSLTRLYTMLMFHIWHIRLAISRLSDRITPKRANRGKMALIFENHIITVLTFQNMLVHINFAITHSFALLDYGKEYENRFEYVPNLFPSRVIKIYFWSKRVLIWIIWRQKWQITHFLIPAAVLHFYVWTSLFRQTNKRFHTVTIWSNANTGKAGLKQHNSNLRNSIYTN